MNIKAFSLIIKQIVNACLSVMLLVSVANVDKKLLSTNIFGRM